MRKYDLIIWGVTGFTGKLLAEYLCRNYGVNDSFKWAIAGRSVDKCQQIQADLIQIEPNATALDIVIADAMNLDSLQKMAAQSKVLCTTVGPYRRFGALLLQACVEQGTHYLDLTGESPFVRESIDLYHQKALDKQLKIVHACGFDSIPSDLGVRFTQQEMMKHKGHYASQIRMLTGKMKGGLSGGTFASMVDLLEEARNDAGIRRLLNNPYALNPKEQQIGKDRGDQMSLKWDSWARKWTCPFMMAGVNTRVVRRSHALQAFCYGRDFQYSEAMGWPASFKGWGSALGITLGLGAFVGLMVSSKWIRDWIHQSFLPQPGEGPSLNNRQKGYFQIHFWAGNENLELSCTVSDDIDPGYECTAKMMAESALSIILEQDIPQSYGVLTPSAAFGDILINRLRNKGMQFVVNP